MSSIPDKALSDSGEKTAILEMLTYLDFNSKSDKLNTVNDIIDDARKYVTSPECDQQKYLNVIESYIRQHPDFGDIKLTDQSTQTDPSKVGVMTDPNGFKGYTFYDENTKENYVAYSGTPAECWVENANAFGPARDNTYYTYAKINGEVVIVGVESRHEYVSEAQANALNYFNYTAVKNGWSTQSNVIVTGHSQGDNNAQYVTMNSDLVDTCYGFDGPGFSPEADHSQFSKSA